MHLQRLLFDLDRLRDVKLNDRVEFPQVLNVKEFTTAEVRRRDKAAAKREMKKGKVGADARETRPEEGKEEDAPPDEQVPVQENNQAPEEDPSISDEDQDED